MMIGNIDYGIDGSNGQEARPDMAPLPLNLLALIISYLDDAADLARACRTCRILHYMCLPALYSNVSLHSYDYIRYSKVDNRPEGSGGASPFAMGVNGLVTRNVAGYVKKLRVWGQWKDHDMEECAKVGRVSDGSMMLNMSIRAAIERTSALESFTWELNTKMLPTVWLGLVQKQTLTSLTVRFPTLRLPQPSTLVPAIASLKSLYIMDIDPLCYPDNISQLLLGSKKLESLKLHWSPRMREAREASVNLGLIFGRIFTAKYKMPLKHIAFHNMYAYNETYSENIFHEILDPATIESFTMISSFRGADDSADFSFVDNSWRIATTKPDTPRMRMLRGDKVSKMHCAMLSSFTTLERYYLITGRKLQDPPFQRPLEDTESKDNGTGSASSGDTRSLALPSICTDTYRHAKPFTPPAEPTPTTRLQQDYLENISRFQGPTLRHLLLLPQWRLSTDDFAKLVRSCPNLEQLGLGLEMSSYTMMRLLIPFLPKLYAIRLFETVDDYCMSREEYEQLGDEWQAGMIANELDNAEYDTLRYIGLGDRVFKISKSNPDAPNGRSENRKTVKRVPLEEVNGLEIWSMDKLEI